MTQLPMEEGATPFYERSNGEIDYPVIIPPRTIWQSKLSSPTTTLENVTSDLVILSNADNFDTIRVNLVAMVLIRIIAYPGPDGSALRVESTEVETPNQSSCSHRKLWYSQPTD